MIRRLADCVDRFLNWLSPPILFTDVLGHRNDLTDLESDCEVFEPDELWAAKTFPASSSVSEGSPLSGGMGTGRPPVEPAGAPGSGAGGFTPKSDEQLIEELVADYRDFVRECFRRRG